MKQKNKNSGLVLPFQGIRAIAIFAILIYHCGNPEMYQLATWSVSVFFILSGFLIGRKGPDENVVGNISIKTCGLYMWKHIKKLYPLHLIMLLISIPVSGMIEDIEMNGIEKLPFWVIVFGMNVTLTKSWYPNYYFGFNGVAWFLSTYAVLCFLSPVLFVRFKELRKKLKGSFTFVSISALIILCFCYCLVIGHSTLNIEYWTYIFPFARIFEYCIGMIAGMTGVRIERNSVSVFQIASVICVFVLIFYMDMPQWLYRSAVWIVPNLILILSVYQNEGILARCFSMKPLVYVGNLSGYIFLIHQVCYSYFTQYGFVSASLENRIVIAIAVLLISLVLANVYQKVFVLKR